MQVRNFLGLFVGIVLEYELTFAATVLVPKSSIDALISQTSTELIDISNNLSELVEYVTITHPIGDFKNPFGQKSPVPTLAQTVATLDRRLYMLSEDLHDEKLWEKPKNLERYGLANATPAYRKKWPKYHDELFVLEEEYRDEVKDVPNWSIDAIPDFYGERTAEHLKGVLVWNTISKVVEYIRYGDGAGGVDFTDPAAVLFYILNARVKDESGTVAFQIEDSQTLLDGFISFGATLGDYLNNHDWGSLVSLFDSLLKAFPKNEYFENLDQKHLALVRFIEDYSTKFLDIASIVTRLRDKMASWMEENDVVEIEDLED
ncbi:hypothetical protein TWF694_004371 [Orbilia ellipsospora]|uniref:Uncharacterized protein n=1 Tax=Orbilia ellipsospora TaxID=2528407 RepID=A0AAV9WXW9_9PEZI